MNLNNKDLLFKKKSLNNSDDRILLLFKTLSYIK